MGNLLENIVSVSSSEFEQSLINSKYLALLDVRTEEEFLQGHISNAINIDVYDLDFVHKVKEQFSSKTPLHIYCHAGVRSMMAAQCLIGEGYKLVNLEYGIVEWIDEGKEIVYKAL